MRSGCLIPRLLVWLVLSGSAAVAVAGEPSHGLAYFGELKYPKDFSHFDYANPQAPKGGTVRLLGLGTFNNLHPYVDKGITEWYSFMAFDRLMKPAEDELSSAYAWLAESVELAEDWSWVAYTLRQNATWHDGSPVTVDDVIWTFETLKREGPMSFRSSYRDVLSIERLGPWSFRFNFREGVRETRRLAMQTASFVPLPKHYWEHRPFAETTLTPPLGNGPYRIAEVDPGRRIVYERVDDYWGKDLNVNIGHNNFDRIEVIYFRDEKVGLQALKAKVVDYWREQNEQNFATLYDFPAVDAGLFKKESYQMGMSYGMHWGIVFNTRRPKLSDMRVREALALAYNFDWSNRTLWYSAMERNLSFFMGSKLASSGLPSPEELALLEPFRGQIPDRVFTDAFTLPQNDGYGRDREALLRADALLEEAGWVMRDSRRVDAATGEPLVLELLVSAAFHERMLVPYAEGLGRLGIEAVLRKVEPNIAVYRLRHYDFDMTMQKVYQFPLPQPGLMQSQLLSDNADRPSTQNYAGIKSPAVDFLVEKIISATSEEELNIAGRALDRILLWSFYLIPEGCPKGRHLVYWDRFGHPPLGNDAGVMRWTGFPYLWWLDREKSARVDAGLVDAEGSKR